MNGISRPIAGGLKDRQRQPSPNPIARMRMVCLALPVTPAVIPLAMVMAMALLAVTGCAVVPAQDSGPLAAYPSSPALDRIKATHAEAATDREQRALLTTWFTGGDATVAEFCSVGPDGRVTTYRYVYDSSWQGEGKGALDRLQVSELQQTLQALPPSQTPRLSNLLIVSFRDYATGRWFTRTYDRTNRPAAVSALFEITAAPIEPALDTAPQAR